MVFLSSEGVVRRHAGGKLIVGYDLLNVDFGEHEGLSVSEI